MPRPPPQNHDALQQQSSHHSAAGMQKSTHQPIKVIVFDKDKNLASFGFCKLKFDNEQGLHIQMLDTDLKETFTVAFEGLCMRKNRYLCFLSSENAIFLVFPDITKCEPIYNLFLALGQPQANNNIVINVDEIFLNNFFIPVVQAIRNQCNGFKDLVAIYKEFVNSLDDEIVYYHEKLPQTFLVEPSSKSTNVDSIGHGGILDFFDSPSEVIVNSSVPSNSSAISEEFDNSWRSSISGDEKLELIPFIKDKIADNISNFKAQLIVDILRKYKNEIVNFLAKCYEEAPENQLVNYVWNILSNGSKFYGISVALLEFAATLEANRGNIKITKISSENESRSEEFMPKKAAATSTEKKESEPQAKKPIRHDPRHDIPTYTPLKYGGASSGRDLSFCLKLNNTKNKSTVSAKINTPASILSSTSHDLPMIIISSSAKNNIPSSPTLSNSVQGSTSSTNNSNSNDLTSDVYYSSHLTNNEDDEKSEEVSRKLRPRDFNYYSKYTPDQSKATTHQSEPEKEEDDEEESDEKFPRIRPRGFGHYLRRYSSSSQPKFTSKQNREESDDLLLDSNEENIPSSVAKHSEAKHKLLVSARYNHFSTLQAPSSLSHVQPTSSNISQPSSSTPKSARRSMLDDDVSDDDSPPEPKRQRKTSFVEAAVDNERPRETVTLATAIQPHFTIDIENKADMQGPNPSKCRIAFPNQRGPCYKPPCLVLEKWVPLSDFEDSVVNSIGAFSNELHLLKIKERIRTDMHFADIKPPEHLVIFDSMLSGIPFKQTYKSLETINCTWPNNPFQIIEHMKAEIAEKRNTYVMKNIFMCFGLDFILYDSDLKRARRNTVQFFEQFLNVIIAAFNPKGPKRYKADEDKMIIDAFPPKLILVTIPQVVSSDPYVTTLNNEITKINDDIRKFVNECKEKAQQKRVFMEIYDWEKACSSYVHCNEADFIKRNDIFMNHLSNQYAILMYPPHEAP